MARKKMILAAASVVTVANATTPPLELVFVERYGRKENLLADMPVRIVDEHGKVVYEGQSKGPYFHAKLPRGRYTVSTRWDTSPETGRDGARRSVVCSSHAGKSPR